MMTYLFNVLLMGIMLSTITSLIAIALAKGFYDFSVILILVGSIASVMVASYMIKLANFVDSHLDAQAEEDVEF